MDSSVCLHVRPPQPLQGRGLVCVLVPSPGWGPLTYDDGVKAAGHEHGRVPGVEVEVAGSQEGGQLPRWPLRLLQGAAAV